MTRCHHCQGRFGLIRHYIGRLAFCSQKCKRAYQVQRDNTIRWLGFLGGRA